MVSANPVDEGSHDVVRPPPAPRAVTWRWSSALFGALCSIPAVVVATQNPSQGIALAIGAIAPAAVGVSGARRGRVASLIVGAAIGLGLVAGAALSQSWWLAVGGIFALCVGAAAASARVRFGSLLLMLAVPMVGAGFSFAGDVRAATELAALMVAGGAFGWLLSLIWPDRPSISRSETALPPIAEMLEYGARLGLAGALCAGIGFALGLEHVGWATAACLLVMRPTAEMTRLRGAGRAISVAAGAAAASVLAVLEVASALLAIAVGGALTGVAATRGSRWYVTGGFTTFLVILLLVYGAPGEAESRLLERVGETLLGVSTALLFGVVLPGRRNLPAT